jgi:hypothetical protein
VIVIARCGVLVGELTIDGGARHPSYGHRIYGFVCILVYNKGSGKDRWPDFKVATAVVA